MSLINEVREDRIQKLKEMREAGIEPYPAESLRTKTNDAFLADYQALEASHEAVTLSGRVMSLREHGGSLFADLFDGSAKVQAYLKEDGMDEGAYKRFQVFVGLGDIIEVTGSPFTTKRGMPSLLGTSWRMAAKALRTVPDEWYGIKDEDERYRKRYLDILLSKDLADRFRRKSLFWNTFRSYLLEKGFIEVDTPVLETTTGGAEARPFRTHHNALDIEVYLRISAGELWQKKLMVAGLPKVFEIGRIFRNEGMSAEHLQDYTQLEFYEAYKDYRAGMEMTRDMYRTVARAVYGTEQFSIRGFEIDLAKEWETYDFNELIEEKYSIDPRKIDANSVPKELTAALEKEGLNEPNMSVERGVDLLWKQIRKTLGGPGFLINVPVYMEPLAKRSRDDSRVVERFQILIAGSEVGKGFSELNDPIDQAGRFKRQQQLRESGDDEAQMNDDSFVEALEYGMPPTFGFGVSERFFSFLEGVSVREAQLFPLMRPKE